MLYMAFLTWTCTRCSPGIPSDDGSDPEHQGHDTSVIDTGETGDSPVDTAPEPACEYVHDDSTETLTEHLAIPLSTWACGEFDYLLDADFVDFSTETEDWVEVKVRAESLGSRANVKISIYDVDDPGDFAAGQSSGLYTQDPTLVFPSDHGRDFVITLQELDEGFGDDFTWQVQPSITKPPVEWDRDEVEDNYDLLHPDRIESGERVFGNISSQDDSDWFVINVPEPSTEDGKIWFTADIDAWDYGSPNASKVTLYAPGAIDYPERYENDYHVDSSGSSLSGASADPFLETQLDEAGDYFVLVRYEDMPRKGSPLHWYVLQVTVSEQ